MTNLCKTENQKYIESLKNFIDARAAMVFAAVIVGGKKMPIAQTEAVQMTENNLLRDSDNLNECIIGKLLINR